MSNLAKDSNRNLENRNEESNCLACRLVSGFGVIGIGAYIAAQAKKQPKILERGLMQFIALGVASIGIARLLNFYPFNGKRTK